MRGPDELVVRRAGAVRTGGDGLGLILLSIAATLFAFWTLVSAGIGIDEAWNLHVVQRVLQGDALYRQVRYFPTPLGVYLAVGGVLGPGVEVLVSKALLAVTFGVTFAAAHVILRSLGAGRGGRTVATVALFGIGVPYASSVYNSVAVAFLLVTTVLVLRWDQRIGPGDAEASRRATRAALGTGVAAAACFLTKWNVGAAAVLAIALGFAVPWYQGRIDRRTWARASALAAASWTVTTAIGLLPVLLQGAGHAFVAQLRDAPAQLDVPISYTSGLRELSRALADHDAKAALGAAPFAVVLFALVPAAVATLRFLARRGDAGPVIASLFFAASTVLLYPRADHVAYVTAPSIVVLVGCAVPLERWLIRRGPVLVAVASVVVLSAPSVAAAVVVDHNWDASHELGIVRTPHFRGALTDLRTWHEIVADTQTLRGFAGPRATVFIISQKAGLYYLVGDLRNPTPYDYPDRTEFGRHGLRHIVRQLQRGEITYTCIDHRYAPGLAPTAVIEAVRRHSHLVTSLHICDLWQTDVPSG